MATEQTLLRMGTPAGRWLVATTVMGSGVAMLSSTAVSVAVPALSRDLDAGVAGVQWILNGYMVTLAALILVGGSLGDRYGRRRVYVIGVAWFAVASLACALAPSVGWLVAARLLQGVGAALLTPGSLALIQSGFVAEDRSAAIGAWSGLTGLAGAAGPAIGGGLVDLAGWRWIFVAPIPLALVVIWAARTHVPESSQPSDGPLDTGGALLAVLSLAAITYPIITVPDQGWTVVTIGSGVLGVLAVMGFIVWERTRSAPMLDMRIFSSRQFTAANLVTFTVYAALGGVFFLLIVHLQTVVGYTATGAAVATLPITGFLLVGSPSAGRLAQRIGPRLPLVVGPGLIAVGMVMMGNIGSNSTYLGGILPALVVFGVGLTLTVTPVTATVLAAADDEHAGVASGVNNAVARTAQLLAVAILPVLAGLTGDDFNDPEAFARGFRSAMIATAVLAGMGALLAGAFIRSDVLGETGPDQHDTECRHCAVDTPPAFPTESAEPAGG